MSLFSRKAYDKLITMSGKKGGVPMLVGELIDVRAFFCQGGAVNHLPKKILTSCPNFYETVGRKRGSYDALTMAYI